MSLKVINDICGYEDKTVVDGIDLEVKEGQFCAVVGLNGCGKTTLLKSICSIIPLSEGQVFVNDTDCLSLNEKQRARLISFIPQRMSSISGMSAIDVVVMGVNPYLGLLDNPNKSHYLKAEQAMDKLGISNIREKEFSHLSEGIKQLVILARTLVQDTPVMLMDEPDSALDYVNKNMVLQKISMVVHSEQKSALISIHDPLSAIRYCDRILFMKDGTIVQDINVKASSREEIENAFALIYGDTKLFTWD